MNYTNYQLVKTLEKMAEDCGFKISRSSYGSEHISLMTQDKDTALPVYARNIALFTGTVEESVCFLQGWYKQREYLTVLLKLKTDRIKDAEQKLVDKYESDRVMSALKTGKDIGWMTPEKDDPNHAPF
jgi:hypothetical protein